MVDKSENWKWGSLFLRTQGSKDQKKILSVWPVKEPKGYSKDVNIVKNPQEFEIIRNSIKKGVPLGGEMWRDRLIDELNLGYTTRGVGRPKNGS